MSVISSDIKIYLSWGAGNTDPNASLGWVISSTEVVDNTLNNLFDNVSWVEHTAWDINYRCIYIKNTNATDTAYNSRIFIDSNTIAVDDTINIGKDLAGVGDGSSTWVADTIADEHTDPDPAVTFTTAVDYVNAILLTDIPAGSCHAVWIKRIVSAGTTAQSNNEATLKVSVDTI